MATFEINAPDGATYEVEAPDGASEDEVLAYVKAQTGDKAVEPADKPFNINEGLYEGKGAAERVIEGGTTLLKKARNAMFPPTSPLDLFASDQGRVSRETRERIADTERSVQRLESGKLGTAGEAGANLTEMGISAIPITRTGTAFAGVAERVLPKVAQKLAPAIGDVAANAAYSGGTTAAGGGSGSDILKSTLLGGAGAAVPHVSGGVTRAGASAVGKVATDVARRSVSPEARALLDEGIHLTPGQMGGGNWMTRLEEGAKNLPGLGGAIERAQGRAGEQYVTKEINLALAPLEVGVKTTGRDAIDEGEKLISDHFNKFVKDVHIAPDDLRMAVEKANANLPREATGNGVGIARSERPGLKEGGPGDYANDPRTNPLPTKTLTTKQAKEFDAVVKEHITPLFKGEENISGRAFKNADAAIGDKARALIKEGDHTMGEALYELQRQLRSSLTPKRLGAVEDIRKANQAFKNFLAISKAGNREGGQFTPEQLRKVTSRMGEKPTPLNKAARKVLTKENTRGMNRNMLGGLAYLGHGVGGAVGGLAAGHVIGKALYSPAGVKRMVEFLDPRQKVKLLGVPEKQRGPLMKAMIANTPSLRQAAAQVGREIATDKENENAP